MCSSLPPHTRATRALKMTMRSRLALIFHRSCKRLFSSFLSFPFHGARVSWKNFLLKLLCMKKIYTKVWRLWTNSPQLVVAFQVKALKTQLMRDFCGAFVFVCALTYNNNNDIYMFRFILGFMNEKINK